MNKKQDEFFKIAFGIIHNKNTSFWCFTFRIWCESSHRKKFLDIGVIIRTQYLFDRFYKSIFKNLPKNQFYKYENSRSFLKSTSGQNKAQNQNHKKKNGSYSTFKKRISAEWVTIHSEWWPRLFSWSLQLLPSNSNPSQKQKLPERKLGRYDWSIFKILKMDLRSRQYLFGGQFKSFWWRYIFTLSRTF